MEMMNSNNKSLTIIKNKILIISKKANYRPKKSSHMLPWQQKCTCLTFTKNIFLIQVNRTLKQIPKSQNLAEALPFHKNRCDIQGWPNSSSHMLPLQQNKLLPDLEEDQYTYQDDCQYTKGHNIQYNYGHGTGCVKQGPETFHNTVFFLCGTERKMHNKNYVSTWCF